MDEITTKTFNKKVLKSKIPILVFFTGKFCYPGKRIEPILNDLSEELGDQIKFVKFMVEEDTFDFAKGLYLKAVPTLLVFKNGVKVNSLIGFEAEPVLRKFIEESISSCK